MRIAWRASDVTETGCDHRLGINRHLELPALPYLTDSRDLRRTLADGNAAFVQ